jgi:hypothetical protein
MSGRVGTLWSGDNQIYPGAIVKELPKKTGESHRLSVTSNDCNKSLVYSPDLVVTEHGSEIKREVVGKGEFSVGLAARRDASPMSRHNQQRSVEESRTLLGGTHAMKSVKPSVDFLEGLSTGVKMDVSAPDLIHKWLNESRQSPSFMLGGLG